MTETKNPLLTVTKKGSVILPNSRLAKPGETFPASLFVGNEASLKRMIAEGVVAVGVVEGVPEIDFGRTQSEQLPPIPGEMDEKKSLRLRAGAKDNQILARVAKLRKRQEALKAAEEAGQELTPEQAKAMGLI